MLGSDSIVIRHFPEKFLVTSGSDSIVIRHFPEKFLVTSGSDSILSLLLLLDLWHEDIR